MNFLDFKELLVLVVDFDRIVGLESNAGTWGHFEQDFEPQKMSSLRSTKYE